MKKRQNYIKNFIVEKTSPKGFSDPKFDVGNWMFPKEFFWRIFWEEFFVNIVT